MTRPDGADAFAYGQTPTGRIAKAEPQFQNLPIRTPEGQRVLEALRKAFREKPTDHNWHAWAAATYGGQPIGFRGTPAKR